MTEQTEMDVAETEPAEDVAPDETAADAASERGTEAEPTEQDLVDEGDLAADYIEELLDIADIDGDIDIDTRNGRAYISVNAEDGSNLAMLAKADTVEKAKAVFDSYLPPSAQS